MILIGYLRLRRALRVLANRQGQCHDREQGKAPFDEERREIVTK